MLSPILNRSVLDCPSPPGPSEVLPAEPELAVAGETRRRVPPHVMVEVFGRSSVSPFLLGPDREIVELEHGVTGYLRRGRWAVMATDPACPAGAEAETVDALLGHLRRSRLRPVFAAVSDPGVYLPQDLHVSPVAEDAVIRLADFSLAGKRRASIRHSVTSARRAGLRVEPWSGHLAASGAEMSASWLATKRGGELGFTLGRFDAANMGDTDCRVALDGEGRVVALTTWHCYDAGRGRVLDIMRRADDAPNPSMDLLLAESLLAFQAMGVEVASLGSVPLSHGKLAERVYPTRSLRRYKDKFAPEWQPRFLVAPSPSRQLGALLAVARAYCQHGILHGLRRNG
jgi:phosphatidylglycerol lysyltransferase